MKPEESLAALLRHLRALWRAEMLIVEIRAGTLLRKSGLMLFAGLIGIFGLAMLNAAAYLALAPVWGALWAAVAVALGDFVIAAILVLVAGRQSRDPEIALAGALRDQALEAIELDARIAVDEVTGMVRRPIRMAGTASAALAAIISAMLKTRRDRRDD